MHSPRGLLLHAKNLEWLHVDMATTELETLTWTMSFYSIMTEPHQSRWTELKPQTI